MKQFLHTLLLTSCWLLLSTTLDAQHVVLLLNGKVHPVKAYDIKGEYLIYSKSSDKSGRTHKMYLDRIYSIRDSILGERIVYMPDTTDSLELTKIEMRSFIEGEQYAIKHYKKPLNAIGGAAVGIGAGFLSIYGLLVPFGYAAIIGSHSPKVPTTLPDAPANVKEEIFQEGYQYKARKVKIKNGLIFGGIGFAASFTLITLLK
ncbi:MAG: hypothetical protein ABI723_09075 [Bacteroidia bacterium]